MKNLILIALAFITLQATAQEQRRERHRRGEHKERAFKRLQNLSPEQLAELQTKRMTLRLDLNEAQQTDVQKLLTEQHKKRQEKIEAFKKARTDENAAKPSREGRLANLNERLDNQIAMKREMKRILNEEQYTKWQKSKAIQKRAVAKRIKSRRRH